MAEDRQTTLKKTIVKTIAGFCGLAAAFTLCLFLFLKSDRTAFVEISGLSKGTEATVSLSQGGNVFPLILQGNSIKSENLPLFSPDKDYIVTATFVQTETNDYRDIVLAYNAATNLSYFIADGFTPEQTVSVRRNGRVLEDGLHFDWSGKIEIPSGGKTDRASSLCLRVEDSLEFCHAFPVGERA